jgi:uncharacterized protein (DUF58 family)
MISPRDRLLIWFALVVIPAAALGGVVPELAPACAAVAGIFVLIATADALASTRLLDGIRLDLPPVTRFVLHGESRIELRVQNLEASARTIRLALPLPPEIPSPFDELTVALPPADCSVVSWPCRPGQRGDYSLAEARLEVPSRLGLWNVRRSQPQQARLRVYPNIQKEHRTLSLMFRGSTGMHSQRQLGKGREFEKLRDYVAGDGSEDIHWKATARRGKPVTKIFQVERTQEVYVAIDCSRLSARADALETHLTTALLLGLAAEHQGDLFGLLAVSDRVEKFVRARIGSTHFQSCRDAIHALEPRPVNPDYEEACSFIRLRLRRRSLVIFLTALDDPLLGENFLNAVDLIARQHLVLVGMVNPSGLAPLFSQPEPENSDGLYGQLARHLRWRHLDELSRQLQHKGVRFVTWDDAQIAMRMVSEYLNLKKRQIL